MERASFYVTMETVSLTNDNVLINFPFTQALNNVTNTRPSNVTMVTASLNNGAVMVTTTAVMVLMKQIAPAIARMITSRVQRQTSAFIR